MAGSASQFSCPLGMGGNWELFRMTIIWKEWQYSEGMTIIQKEWHKVFFWKKNILLAQLALLPPLGHKEAIGSLGYPIALKLKD
jgi:hypothetical protein